MSDCCCSIWHSSFDISLIEIVLELFMPLFSGEGKGGGAYLRGGAYFKFHIEQGHLIGEGTYLRKYGSQNSNIL